MDKADIRKRLVQQRMDLPDRLQRAEDLQRVMRIWLVGQPDVVIGAYWPIKGEFDPLPALYRWQEDGGFADGGLDAPADRPSNDNLEDKTRIVQVDTAQAAINFIRLGYP
jgi:hypothetical protein